MTRARELADSADKDFAGTVTVDNIVVDTDLQFATGATVTTILDEDAMGSDSATALSTQQAIKAYVDTQVATVPTGDITEVTAGTGLTGGGTTGVVTLNIDSTVATLTGTQTLTNKTLGATTVTGNATFGDNDKAIFGAGSDLQIYHDAGNSRIVDAGTGNLNLQADNNINILNNAGTEFKAQFITDGAVNLFYDNSKKFETTSTGVDVTGTAVTDGLTVAGNVSVDGGTIKLDGNYPVGTNNVALGNAALDDGSLSGGNNTAIGHQSLTNTASGANNTAIGMNSMVANTSGGLNVAVGGSALTSNTTGSSNTALGLDSLNSNTTASNNTAVGYYALQSNTAANNVALGYGSAYQNTSGTANTAIGYYALQSNTTASNNTAVGYQAAYSNTTGTSIDAFGTGALYANTEGSNNAGFAAGSLVSNTTGSSNSAFGRDALRNNTTASNNTAVGYQAGYTNTDGTAINAFGYEALYSNTTGVSNSAFGGLHSGVINAALKNNTTGSYNSAFASGSLLSNSTGSNNSGFGWGALANNTEANNNTAVGYQAGFSNTTGAANVFLGYRAGYLGVSSPANTILGFRAGENNTSTNGYNTFVGNYAGYSNTSGYNNTFVGARTGGLAAGYYVTTGSKNTIIGGYDGNQGGLDIRTLSNYIVLSDGDGNPRGIFDSSGNFLVGTTSTSASLANTGVELYSDGRLNATRSLAGGASVVYLNRKTSDGVLVSFRQDDTEEGYISVSGTTVSYTGGHLARWSRLADDSKDTSIVKGTVMTNLDEMVEWGDEDNEQLNKMAVSSVEGDANVAGVFVNWDNDDWNDMNVAMTGDMVIRIAQGTTVARGDLLMSAGDGTAKPQGDDIVRSKTIAKVTSTNVSHTYDDGSYLVPCVLMAC